MPEVREATLTLHQMGVIASPGRIRVLKLLRERRRTVSELTRTSHMAKSTLFAHLETLEAVQLVRRVQDPGRVWVYYELTPLGRIIAESNPLRLVVFVALAIASLALALAAFWRRSGAALRPEDPPWYLPPVGVPARPPEPGPALDEPALAVGLLALAGIAFLLLAWREAKRARGRARARQLG